MVKPASRAWSAQALGRGRACLGGVAKPGWVTGPLQGRGRARLRGVVKSGLRDLVSVDADKRRHFKKAEVEALGCG